jgi:hypothetical protein
MTQVVDFLLHFLDKHNIKHIFYFCGRGVLGCEGPICVMTSIIPTYMSYPISCTDSELAAHNLTKIHLDSPYPDELERNLKHLWTVLNLTTGTKPIWSVVNLNMGGKPPWTVLRLRYIMCDIY